MTELKAVDIVTVESVLVPVRMSCAAEIKELLEKIGNSYLRVGALLIEAREDFEGQKDFMEWVESEFNIKKAQCYHLMNIARVFRDDKRFHGVAMRVMLALLPMADEAEVMEKAASLAEAGTLTSAAVNELLGKPVKTKQSEVIEVVNTPETETLPPVEPETLPVAPVAPDFPGVDASPNPVPVTMTVEDTATQGLLSQIQTLTQSLLEAQERIAALTSTRESKKSSAPMLPQFKSQCLYARLGLSAEEAQKKTAVNKAKRELVKLGYGDGHEAWPFIDEAVTELTK